MDHRLFFVLGDLTVNIVVGAAVAWLCALFVGVGWNMFLAMILSMIIGMIIGTLLFFPLGIAFGAMEVMLPAMFTGMVSGMVVGMWATMEPLSGMSALAIGGVCGLACIVSIWILNNSVKGVQTNG
jgi:hypothetical protein